MTQHDPRSVANRFIEKAIAQDQFLDPLQTNKLTYFAHAWMLAIHNRPLLDAPIQAWGYGPISPPVYDALRDHGLSPVSAPIPDVPQRHYDKEQESVINQTYDLYRHLTGRQLSSVCHMPGTPWDQVATQQVNYYTRHRPFYYFFNKTLDRIQGRKTPRVIAHADIPDRMIQEYYEQLLEPAPSAYTI